MTGPFWTSSTHMGSGGGGASSIIQNHFATLSAGICRGRRARDIGADGNGP